MVQDFWRSVYLIVSAISIYEVPSKIKFLFSPIGNVISLKTESNSEIGLQFDIWDFEISHKMAFSVNLKKLKRHPSWDRHSDTMKSKWLLYINKTYTFMARSMGFIKKKTLQSSQR